MSETINYSFRNLQNIFGMLPKNFPYRFMYIAPSNGGHSLLNLNLPFVLILRRFEVVFWCLDWECCTFKRSYRKFIQISDIILHTITALNCDSGTRYDEIYISKIKWHDHRLKQTLKINARLAFHTNYRGRANRQNVNWQTLAYFRTMIGNIKWHNTGQPRCAARQFPLSLSGSFRGIFRCLIPRINITAIKPIKCHI